MFCHKCGTEVAEGTAFCKSCGQQLQAAEASPAQPMPIDDNQNTSPSMQSTQDVQQGVTGDAHFSPGQGSYSQSTSSNQVISDSVDVVKKFLSKNPNEAVKAARERDTPVWAVLGGLYVLIFSLMMVIVIHSMFRSLFGELMQFIDFPGGSIFGNAFLYSAVLFFAFALGTKGVFAIAKIEISTSKVMNFVAAAFIPSIAGFAAAIIIGLISIPLAMAVIAVTSMASLVLLYAELQNMPEFESSPLWLFMGLYAACMLCVYLLFTITAPDWLSMIL